MDRLPLIRRHVAATLLGVVAVLLLLVPVAVAEDILRLDGVVTDTTGALAGSEGDIEDAAEGAAAAGVQPFVLFVSTTGDRSAEDYAFETARTNSLGIDDALILVALDDRTDYIWLSDGLDNVTDELYARAINNNSNRVYLGEPRAFLLSADIRF